MIPASHLFDQSTLTALLDHDPMVADYRAFFSLLDWSVVERWEAECWGCDRVPLTCKHREQDAGDHKGPPRHSSPPSPLRMLMSFVLG